MMNVCNDEIKKQVEMGRKEEQQQSVQSEQRERHQRPQPPSAPPSESPRPVPPSASPQPQLQPQLETHYQSPPPSSAQNAIVSKAITYSKRFNPPATECSLPATPTPSSSYSSYGSYSSSTSHSNSDTDTNTESLTDGDSTVHQDEKDGKDIEEEEYKSDGSPETNIYHMKSIKKNVESFLPELIQVNDGGNNGTIVHQNRYNQQEMEQKDECEDDSEQEEEEEEDGTEARPLRMIHIRYYAAQIEMALGIRLPPKLNQQTHQKLPFTIATASKQLQFICKQTNTCIFCLAFVEDIDPAKHFDDCWLMPSYLLLSTSTKANDTELAGIEYAHQIEFAQTEIIIK